METETPAARAAPFYLFSAGGPDAKPAVTLGQAWPKTRNGMQAFYYWRPVIADGEYVHPTKRFRLSVDAKRRKTWEENFRRMAEHGEEPPVVEDHDDDKSRATLGYVVDVRQNGPWYEELHQYLGADARDIALRNKISVGIDPEFHTGNGVKIGDCIIHSATTPRPIVPGQGEAVLAASRGMTADVLELSGGNCGTGAGGFHGGNTCAKGSGGGAKKSILPSRDDDEVEKAEIEKYGPTPAGVDKDEYRNEVFNEAARNVADGFNLHEAFERAKTTVNARFSARSKGRKKVAMSRTGDPMNEQQLDAIRDLIGADELTDETAIPQLLEWGKNTRNAATVAAQERDTARTELSRRPAPKVTDPDILAEAAALKLEKVEHLVTTGTISEHAAEFLRKRVKDADGKPRALMLSRTSGAEESPIDALLTFAALAKSGVKSDGESQTGVQELSRQTHDHSGVTGGGSAKQPTAEELARAVEENLSSTSLGRRMLAARKAS